MRDAEYYSPANFNRRYSNGRAYEKEIIKLLNEDGIAAREGDKYCHWDIEVINTPVRIEAKIRDNNLHTYPTVFLPVNKLDALQKAGYETIIVHRFNDVDAYCLAKQLDLSAYKIELAENGKAKTDNYCVPVEEFSTFEDITELVRLFI